MLDALTALTRGTRLVYSRGLRRYVFLPIVVNLLVYGGMLWYVLVRRLVGGWPWSPAGWSGSPG